VIVLPEFDACYAPADEPIAAHLLTRAVCVPKLDSAVSMMKAPRKGRDMTSRGTQSRDGAGRPCSGTMGPRLIIVGGISA